MLLTSPLILFGEAGFGQTHKLVENSKFEFELDSIDHRFDSGFSHIVVCKFEANQDDIHTNTYAIDTKELQHDFPSHTVIDRA